MYSIYLVNTFVSHDRYKRELYPTLTRVQGDTNKFKKNKTKPTHLKTLTTFV